MLNYLIRLTHYNLWANRKMVSMIKNVKPEDFDLIQKSSFNTIRQTIHHIIDAEQIWLGRLKGNEIEIIRSNTTGNMDESLSLLTCISEDFHHFVAELKESQINQIVEYSNSKELHFSNSFYEIITHVTNHSTFHRGQLITMLRGTGYDTLEPTDMIAFYRSFSNIPD